MCGLALFLAMGTDKFSLERLIAYCREYGFVFQSSEIYGGLSAVYDYGPYGVLLKRNIAEWWWRAMTQLHENIVGIDTSILMHPKVWEASGHTEHFIDFFVDNTINQKRYRADQLLQLHIEKLRQSGDHRTAEQLCQRLHSALVSEDPKELTRLLVEFNVEDPESKQTRWTEVRRFNLMFSTQVGQTPDTITVYLRPETAQGIYVNFLNGQRTARLKVPFGIAQIGKAFRNEIVARQFLLRMREFEQMEMQFFVRPEDSQEWFGRWVEWRRQWYLTMGIPPEIIRIKPHEHLAHYAQQAVDIEFDFGWDCREIEGIHNRGDYDLCAHERYSGKKIQYFDPEINRSYTPHVVETSAGLDRLFLAVLSAFLRVEELSDGSTRLLLAVPPLLAPVHVGVFPLVRKDSLPEKAREIFGELSLEFRCFYEEKDSIGRRYRRHDAIGTPYCITVDYQTLKDHTVTIRDRNTMEQWRVTVKELAKELGALLSWSKWLRELRDRIEQSIRISANTVKR